MSRQGSRPVDGSSWSRQSTARQFSSTSSASKNGWGSKSKPKSNKKPPPPPPPTLPGPVHDEEYLLQKAFPLTLIAMLKGSKYDCIKDPVSVLNQWLNKVGHHLTTVSKLLKSETIHIEGQRSIFVRSTLKLEYQKKTYTGLGDSSRAVTSNRLACMHLALQLADSGLLTAAVVPQGPTATLSDGKKITYERALQFMEYYCNRFKFGKPFVNVDELKDVKGKNKHNWEASMVVGGRTIGVGTGVNKKAATENAYLDVTVYLESCDRALWEDFDAAVSEEFNAPIGLAPPVSFTMSQELDDEINGLVEDIKGCELYSRKPPDNTNIESEENAADDPLARRYVPLTPEYKRQKSDDLKKRHEDYMVSNSVKEIREQRLGLPVMAKADEIIRSIEENEVSIIMAATGSGKTTQIPQIILDDAIRRGEGATTNVWCTQPRRLAAISVAQRVAAERGEACGESVGYQVRFDARLPRPHGSLTFCTTGIFLKLLQGAIGHGDTPAVKRFDEISHIIVDEAHERDIDTDLLLVCLKKLLEDRRRRGVPLKVMLMSATIDPSLFQKYFADTNNVPAPVRQVEGRSFPVEKKFLDDFWLELQQHAQSAPWVMRDKETIQYRNNERVREPGAVQKDDPSSPVPSSLIALTVSHVLCSSEEGHVLVFLDGLDTIKGVKRLFEDRSCPLPANIINNPKYEIHVIHSSIPVEDQQKIFKKSPPGIRRIILATNIAETSVTIPDVVYVVDSGRVKEKRYDPGRHMSSLVSSWVGRSNVNQRAGRAGRHRPGQYYSMISKARELALQPYQTVEMKREDLSNVVMHIKGLNIRGMDVEEVLANTIEPPEETRVTAAIQRLQEIGAIDDYKRLSPLGRLLLKLPVDAHLAKLVLYGAIFRCLDQALTLAALLSCRDPFMAPEAARQEASQVKRSWAPQNYSSDALAIFAAFEAWNDLPPNSRASSDFVRQNFLSYTTLTEIKRLKLQLFAALEATGVLNVSAGGRANFSRRVRTGEFRNSVPPALSVNGTSLPVLAAMIALTNAPQFGVRVKGDEYRTAQDQSAQISMTSLNSSTRLRAPEDRVKVVERQILAYNEKSFVPGQGPQNKGAQTNLRMTTMLDPMGYLLFGAHRLVLSRAGLEVDGWLPIQGHTGALASVAELKVLLDECLLRVFEGVGHSLSSRATSSILARARAANEAEARRLAEEATDEDDVLEHESEDGSLDDDNSGERRRVTREVLPLSAQEVTELDHLTTDIVNILNQFSAENKYGRSWNNTSASAPVSRGSSPTPPINAFASAQRNFSSASLPTGPRADGIYRPPVPTNGRGVGGSGYSSAQMSRASSSQSGRFY